MKMGKIEKLFVNSPSHSQQVSQHAEKLLKLVDFEAGQKYLDLGCGNGTAPIFLAKKYLLDVTGVDVDPDQIRLAEANSQDIDHARFFTVDATQLPFENHEFDLVSTNKVTHHIPTWQDAVTEMIRVLKPGGYFIYADLVYPGWLAGIGTSLAPNLAGFPAAEALNSLFDEHKLSKVHRSTSLMHYEAVHQKLIM
jgi:ubiquinone/menaquinone biosynthesis C-methylase UbiE